MVRCSFCKQYQYCAPRTETGREVRTVSTTHRLIKPNQRARILERATGRCELCGSGRDLHVGHLLSVADGHEHGLSDDEINSDDNLSAMCAECNLGLGRASVPPRLLVALVVRRAKATA